MKVIIKKSDGSVVLMELAEATDVDSQVDIIKENLLGDEYVSHRVVDDSQIPEDSYFFEAWTDDYDTDTVDVDMTKAQNIHMGKIRAARSLKFEELGFPTKLDADLEAAIIPESTRATLQTLRDIPQNIDLTVATTPDELKAIWPEELL